MQISIFDENNRLKKLEKMGDVLSKMDKVINWEIFRPILDRAIPREKNPLGGRPPYDNLLIYKIIVIKRLFNLSAEETEYQINDRLSFMKFLHLGLGDAVPDAKTIWLYEEKLAKSGTDKELFELLNKQIEEAGYITRAGSIVDATFIEAPKRKNTKEQREKLKNGEIPEEWVDENHPQKTMQRDLDATWAVKNNEAHFGYKDTVKVDAESKIIVDFNATTASMNDKVAAEGIFDEKDCIAYGDCAYPSLELPENVENRICESPTKNHPLSTEQKERNHAKAAVRCRVEHVFAGMVQMVGGTTLRCKNLVRAKFNITMLNMVYNMRRFVFLARV